MYLRYLLLLLFTHVAIAGPWWTGPLLAPAGKTIPPGHVNFEPYGFYTVYPKGFRNIEAVPVITVGLLDFMDFQSAIPLDHSWINHGGPHSGGIGDLSLGLGFQLVRQKEGSWWPDVRLVIQEVFPTGRYDNLSFNKAGTDQTGSGSYQTSISATFQKLSTLENGHYLRTRLNISGSRGTTVHVHGLSAFGGGSMTEGKVHPGGSYSVDLAFEYALTQHWVPVFEVLYVNSSSVNFDGNPGFTPGGAVAGIGGAGSNSVSLAPAIEYNINSNLGIIAGVWFSVTGPHAAKFTSTAVAVNYYF